MVGVVGLHGCKDLNDEAEVLLDQLIFYGDSPVWSEVQHRRAWQNLEGRNMFFGAFKVGGNVQQAAEARPLVPGGGLFIEDC